MKKFIALYDSHGSLRDEQTIDAACQFARDFKPDLMIHGGDNWDHAALRTGASEEDQAIPIAHDYKCAEDTLDRFFGSWHKAKKVYLHGNHDKCRLEKLLNSPKAIVASAAQSLIDDIDSTIKRFCDISVEYDADNGIFDYEGMAFVHGYAHGIYACKAHAESYGTCIFGHTHAFGVFVMHNRHKSTAYNVGGACKLRQPYNRSHRATLRQQNGFAYGFLDGSEHFHDVHFARKMPDGTFFLPTEWNSK